MGMRPPGTPQYSGNWGEGNNDSNDTTDRNIMIGTAVLLLAIGGIMWYHRDELKQDALFAV